MSWLRSRLWPRVSDFELFVGLLVDVAVLTGQLYFSGGIRNPFIFLFLLQVAVSSVLLPPRYVWAIVVMTSLGFLSLTTWHQPLDLPSLDGPVFSMQYTGGLLFPPGCVAAGDLHRAHQPQPARARREPRAIAPARGGGGAHRAHGPARVRGRA
jgi:hypothetical protein